MKKLALVLLFAFFFIEFTISFPITALGATAVRVYNGGTATTSFNQGLVYSPGGILPLSATSAPSVSTLHIASNLCLLGDCRSAWPTGGSGTFSWTPTTYGNATGTTLGFLNGFLSSGSSTAQKLNITNGTTTNSVATHSSSTDLYTSGSTILAAVTGRVGIATTAPAYALSVAGDIQLNTALRFTASGGQIYGASNGVVSIFPVGDQSGTYGYGFFGGSIRPVTDGNADLGQPTKRFRNGWFSYGVKADGGDLSYILGKLGVGTTTPFKTLQVADTRPSLAISDSSAGLNQKHWLLSSIGGNLYVGTASDVYATSSPNALTILNNGNLGVLKQNPVTALDIVGTASSTGLQVNGNATTSGSFYHNGTTSMASLEVYPGALPSLSDCGTGAYLEPGSNDHVGRFYGGTGDPTSCTIVFAKPKARNPFCQVTSSTVGATFIYSSSTASQLVIGYGLFSGVNDYWGTYRCDDNLGYN